MNINQDVLEKLTNQLSEGKGVKAESDEEQAYFQLIKDLDHINGKVEDSMTSKKYMHNEIWSLISFKEAPSCYITLSPADIKHPICIYILGVDEKHSGLYGDTFAYYGTVKQQGH